MSVQGSIFKSVTSWFAPHAAQIASPEIENPQDEEQGFLTSIAHLPLEEQFKIRHVRLINDFIALSCGVLELDLADPDQVITGPFRTLSVNYLYARGLSEQVAVGWQWPVYRGTARPVGTSSFEHLSEEELEAHLGVSRYGDFLLMKDYRPAEAVEVYLSSLPIRRGLSEAEQFWTFGNLGRALVQAGRPAEAESYLRKAVAVGGKMSGADGDTEYAFLSLADSLHRQGKHAEAESVLMDLIKRVEPAARKNALLDSACITFIESLASRISVGGILCVGCCRKSSFAGLISTT